MNMEMDLIMDGPTHIPPIAEFSDQDFQIKINGEMMYSDVTVMQVR